MTQILTVMVDQDADGRVSVNWVSSDMPPQLVFAAADAVRNMVQRKMIETEVRAQIAAETEDTDA